jgi:hypothetical protein
MLKGNDARVTIIEERAETFSGEDDLNDTALTSVMG